jgi:hypothetical protein
MIRTKKSGPWLAAVGLLGQAAMAAAEPLHLQTFEPAADDPALVLGSYTHPAGGKTLTLYGGAGSGAYRGPGDPPDIVWTVGDRGPNIACADAPAVLGLTAAVACPADPTAGVAAGVGRLYPRPAVAPTIYKLRLERGGRLRVLESLPLRRQDGTIITGLLNPQVTATTEIPRDGAGRVLEQDAAAIDAEGLVRVPHFGGRFFIGEENATGLVEVGADGRILKRFVPAGTEGEFTAPRAALPPAGYSVEGALPALLAKRRVNRGIESLTISEDFRFLYFIVQSPLDHPNTTVRDSANIRLYKARLDLHPRGSSLQVVGEWVYTLDPVELLRSVGVTDATRVADLRVSEMIRIEGERFLVIERTDQATALFEIDLAGATNILGTAWDDAAVRPTLEQTADLAAAGIVPASKTLRFLASSLEGASPRFAAKLEGLAFTPDRRLIVINDDDYGITGQRVRADVVTGGGFGPQAPPRLHGLLDWLRTLP